MAGDYAICGVVAINKFGGIIFGGNVLYCFNVIGREQKLIAAQVLAHKLLELLDGEGNELVERGYVLAHRLHPLALEFGL